MLRWPIDISMRLMLVRHCIQLPQFAPLRKLQVHMLCGVIWRVQKLIIISAVDSD